MTHSSGDIQTCCSAVDWCWLNISSSCTLSCHSDIKPQHQYTTILLHLLYTSADVSVMHHTPCLLINWCWLNISSTTTLSCHSDIKPQHQHTTILLHLLYTSADVSVMHHMPCLLINYKWFHTQRKLHSLNHCLTYSIISVTSEYYHIRIFCTTIEWHNYIHRTHTVRISAYSTVQ